MKPFSATSLFITLLFAGCAKENMDDCITSTGPRTIEHRNVEYFQRIKIEDRIDLVLTQDTLAGPSITVEAGRNVLESIVTEVRDGELHIANTMRCNWVRRFKERPVVRVTLPALERITYSAVGDVSATTPIRGHSFRMEQWGGQGTVRLQLDVDTCWIGLHTGVGDAVLGGTANVAYFYAINFGHINARDLAADVVHVDNSGSGDVHCRPGQYLRSQIHNVGDVYYAGSPAELESIITGSGRLIHE